MSQKTCQTDIRHVGQIRNVKNGVGAMARTLIKNNTRMMTRTTMRVIKRMVIKRRKHVMWR